MSVWAATNRQGARKWILSGLALAAAVILLLHQVSTSTPYTKYLPGNPLRSNDIPNVVHFTQLRRYPTSELHFSFQSFLALYSALRMLKPTRIYIHTDFDKKTIAKASKVGSTWTRLILTAFPDVVELKQISLPTHVNGHKIDNVEAKSDLVRWEQIYAIGGIYLDWDILTLRDASMLRKLGFNNVVGRQRGGKVNTGCILAKQRSALTYLMRREQYIVFDNTWETHSVKLLTDISNRLVRTPNEVLIMDEAAMAPIGWESTDTDQMFSPHKDTTIPSFPQINDPNEDPIARWDKKTKSESWERDYSATYFLHAFRARNHEVPDFKGVTANYVLKRNSNYALAAWPIVKMAIGEGLFNETSDEL